MSDQGLPVGSGGFGVVERNGGDPHVRMMHRIQN